MGSPNQTENEPKSIGLKMVLLAVQNSGFYVWSLAILSKQVFDQPTALPFLFFVGPILAIFLVSFVWSTFESEKPEPDKSALPGAIQSAIFPALSVILITPFSIGAWIGSKLSGKDEGGVVSTLGGLSYLTILALTIL